MITTRRTFQTPTRSAFVHPTPTVHTRLYGLLARSRTWGCTAFLSDTDPSRMAFPKLKTIRANV